MIDIRDTPLHDTGHLLCAVDVETTGLFPITDGMVPELGRSLGEVIQVAVQPIDRDYKPQGEPFMTLIAPRHPELSTRTSENVHGIEVAKLHEYAPDPQIASGLFYDWFVNQQLPIERKLIMLGHNTIFETRHLLAWLGEDMYNAIFHFHTRCTMTLAAAVNDWCAFNGEAAFFPSLGLESVCGKLGVVNLKAHDAYHDAIASAECYEAMMRRMRF